MSQLELAQDFLKSTRDLRLHTPGQLLNEALRRNHFFFSKLFTDATDQVGGGKELTRRVRTSLNGSFETYGLNDLFTATDNDTIEEQSVPWAFSKVHYVLRDELVTLNGTASDADKFLDYLKMKESGALADAAEGYEDQLWAAPDASTMESANPTRRNPYSILSYVTRAGNAPVSGVDGCTANWSTVMGVDPTTATWFQNQTSNYDSAALDDADDGLLSSFDEMTRLVKFETPSILRGNQVEFDVSGARCAIVTNGDGKDTYTSRLRASNDRLGSLNDPYTGEPLFNGVPIKYVEALDDAGWTAGQPDYLFLNFDAMKPYFHKDRFMYEKATPGGISQANTLVVNKFTMHNLFCHSRRRLGRISAS